MRMKGDWRWCQEGWDEVCCCFKLRSLNSALRRCGTGRTAKCVQRCSSICSRRTRPQEVRKGTTSRADESLLACVGTPQESSGLKSRRSKRVVPDRSGVGQSPKPKRRAVRCGQALYDTLRQRDLVRKVELRALSEVPPKLDSSVLLQAHRKHDLTKQVVAIARSSSRHAQNDPSGGDGVGMGNDRGYRLALEQILGNAALRKHL